MNQIITLTLAPAVDVEYHSAGSQPGLNRTYSHTVTAGGKGINVSRAILRLSDENETPLPLKTVFPCAGETGTLLRNLLENEGMDTNGAVETSGSTRVNTSLIPDHGREIEINAPGAPLTEDELAEIEERVLDNLLPGDVVCICGSVPAGVAKSYPAHLAKKVRRRGGIAVLDCDGEALIEAAKMDEDDAADLIKPNSAELSGLLSSLRPEFACFAKDGVRSENELRAACKALPFGSVIMTMAGDGSMYCSGGEVFTQGTTSVKVARLKGAGDTFLGAYVYYRYIAEVSARDAMAKASAEAARYVAGN